jgi:hypothetical protein
MEKEFVNISLDLKFCSIGSSRPPSHDTVPLRLLAGLELEPNKNFGAPKPEIKIAKGEGGWPIVAGR